MFMKSCTSQTYALMRIVVGFLFLFHGLQKLFGIPIPGQEGMPAYITYIAGPIELVGGLLIMIGFFTRPAAFLSSGLMAVAYWKAHGMNALFPIANQGEMAVFYSFVFLFISAQGSGIWSVDDAMGKS